MGCLRPGTPPDSRTLPRPPSPLPVGCGPGVASIPPSYLRPQGPAPGGDRPPWPLPDCSLCVCGRGRAPAVLAGGQSNDFVSRPLCGDESHASRPSVWTLETKSEQGNAGQEVERGGRLPESRPRSREPRGRGFLELGDTQPLGSGAPDAASGSPGPPCGVQPGVGTAVWWSPFARRPAPTSAAVCGEHPQRGLPPLPRQDGAQVCVPICVPGSANISPRVPCEPIVHRGRDSQLLSRVGSAHRGPCFVLGQELPA